MKVLNSNKKQPVPEAFLEVADAFGKPLLIMPREHVLRQKLRHKAVAVCLRNACGNIFLYKAQYRAATHYGGLWNLAAFGEVLAGESFYDAAERRLAEEIAVTGVELHETARLAPSPQTGNAETAIFLTTKNSMLPRYDSRQNGMFVDRDEIRALLRDFPHMVSPFLRQALPYLF